ncbi:MAG: helix-turn-helix transcriptional regulator [Deltaproteobacteria bacterium]|nr:helix-turn-helix transcriptional regulator [Deltaproteobacteria bacterium]MBW2176562.1 helix-turn-helix transcriptional regulator [Deltaproteobacteria bacterium]
MDPFSVARTIKNLRKKKAYSLNKLSELSGLSKGYLSKIENGINVPTITTMARIATALEVDVTYFFLKQGESVQNRKMVAVRKGERKEINIKIPESVVRKRWPLASRKYDRHMDPYIIEVPVESTNTYQFEGEEFYYLLAGKIELTYGGERYVFEEGDSVYLDCNIPYSGRSLGPEPAKVLVVVYHIGPKEKNA